MKKVELKVAELKQKEAGKSIARLSTNVMGSLKISPGDIIKITGEKSTPAITWPSYKDVENNEDIIRIDGITRGNAEVGIGDTVKVEKIDVKKGEKLIFAPSVDLRFDEEFNDYVREYLIDRPIVKGDKLLIGVLGRTIPLMVINTVPKGIVQITNKTAINITKAPVKPGLIQNITYEDIGGLSGEIQKIREVVEIPLKHPELFKTVGIEPPKGVLLHGPPGCGKTLLAKAVATESNANFVVINGPEVMSKFYGQSEENLREVFKEAQENVPSIVFIDEMDAIAPKRDDVSGEVERRVVSQLLSLMDGLKDRGQLIVIGATNRPNAIDPALRRPGRFDREIEVRVPNRKGRLEILQIHTRTMPLEGGIDLDELADITHGFSGADIAALCREAAMKTLRRFLPKIDLENEIIPSQILKKIKINERDFTEALKEVQPSLMREVLVENPDVQWTDIGGLDEVKQELIETVEWPIKHPKAFKRMGVRPTKGVLLSGKPGTGKTLLAKAVASESGVNFISVKGPELLNKYVGESERAVRELFRRARIVSPAIVFIDEIDSLAPHRDSGIGDSHVTERVVSQLLTEIDGLERLEKVIVIAATNRLDLLDIALLRPGRFDKILTIPLPDQNTRLQIFKIHTKDMPLNTDVQLEELAKITEGFVGADIEGVCREAALLSLREDINAKEVKMKHFEQTLKKVRPTILKKPLIKQSPVESRVFA